MLYSSDFFYKSIELSSTSKALDNFFFADTAEQLDGARREGVTTGCLAGSLNFSSMAKAKLKPSCLESIFMQKADFRKPHQLVKNQRQFFTVRKFFAHC